MPQLNEYEVKVTYAGDIMVLTHEAESGQIVVEYDAETRTTTEAVRDLLDNLYTVEVEFTYSGDLPGGKHYVVVETAPVD